LIVYEHVKIIVAIILREEGVKLLRTLGSFLSSDSGICPGFLFETVPAKTHGGHRMPSKLYVGNLAYSVASGDLEALFSQAGTVQSAAVIMDKFSGQSKGFGFVEMSSAEEASAAIQRFNDTELKGRNIKVNEAKPRESSFGGGNNSGRNRY
jgi:RNA recognition motif-containing protein